MKKLTFRPVILALAFCLMTIPQTALADITQSFGNLPDNIGFFAGGNGDGYFTITTATYGTGSINLAVRGFGRHVGPLPTNLDEYTCVAGQQCNIDFSVSTTGALTLSDFTYSLDIWDLTTSRGTGFDPSAIPDNAKETNIFQNSEWFGWSFINTPLNYQPTDQVLVTLSANPTNPAIGPDPSARIGFNVSPSSVPEPSAVILTLTTVGLLGLKQLRRRRQKA